MQIILVVILTFALCFAVDKGFSTLFRRKPQHRTGKSVRLTKKYALVGIIILFLAAVLAVNACVKEELDIKLLAAAGILAPFGILLIVYFATFGVYYDNATFLWASFGKKAKEYPFGQIETQQILLAKGTVCIDLFLADGRDLAIYTNMEGAYDFLDAAFAGWCREKGLTAEDCPWYDPDNSCWFPPHDPEEA